MTALLVFLGGGLGSLLRYGVAVLAPSHSTLIVNGFGSFAMGALLGLLPAEGPVARMLITGVLGGFTTYSAFSGEVLSASQRGSPREALLQIALMLGVTLPAVFLGQALAMRVRP